MATIPEEAFGGRIAKAVTKKVYRYGIILVVLIELLSMLLKELGMYSVTTYVILTQLCCAILVYNNFYKFKPRVLCVRKRIAYKVLVCYYLFGISCLVFGLDHGFYTYIVNPLMLGTVLLLTLYTIKDEQRYKK